MNPWVSSDIQRTHYERLYSKPPIKSTSCVHRLIRRYELHRTDAVAALVDVGRDMLDIGAGEGDLALRCAPCFERIVGIDLAYERVRTARERATRSRISNVLFAAANVDSGLPLGDSSIDVATAVAVVGFIFDPLALLVELRRVLRPGGRLILEVLNLAYLPRRLALLFGRLPRHSYAEGWDGQHLHNFTRGALNEALVAHGFQVEVWTGSGVLAPLRTWWPSLLTGNLIVRCRRV